MGKNNELLSGWDAILAEFNRVYPSQEDHMHCANYEGNSGENPLSGVSIFEGKDYWHLVTFGLTELFEKESKDKEFSGFGLEYTIKLKKNGNSKDKKEQQELINLCDILQYIAKLVFDEGRIFDINQYIYTGQTAGIDVSGNSPITGFIAVADTTVKPIKSKTGSSIFIELVGATDKELKKLSKDQITVPELYKKIGSDITDYGRKSVI